jgi:hypothetical protein
MKQNQFQEHMVFFSYKDEKSTSESAAHHQEFP